MVRYLLHCHRPHLFGHQTGQSFLHRHSQLSNARLIQSDRRRQHQIGAIRLQQIRRANIDAEPPRNQPDHIHKSFGWIARLRRQARNFVPGDYVVRLERTHCMFQSWCGSMCLIGYVCLIHLFPRWRSECRVLVIRRFRRVCVQPFGANSNRWKHPYGHFHSIGRTHPSCVPTWELGITRVQFRKRIAQRRTRRRPEERMFS